MPISAGTRLGVFEILALIGKGGMGEVYRAKDTKLEREIAIKILPERMAERPDRMARFEREARLLAALDHPHIAAIHGLHEEGGQHFLVMELVEGEALKERLKRGPLAVQEALEVAREIAEALETAHEKGIIHRDLKPSNVMLTAKGRAKVLDFGLGKAVSEHPRATAAETATATASQDTAAGAVLGTAPYMSPEQARGQPVDKRADNWAFGCVLYELLTGRSAFLRDTGPDTTAAILGQEPDWDKLPSRTPESIRGLMGRCLQKEPDRRLRDVGDASLEIESALGSLRWSSGGSGVAAPRPRSRLLAGLGSAAILLVFAAVLGRFYIWPATGPESGGGATPAAFDAAEWIIAVVPAAIGTTNDAEITALNEGLALTLTGRLARLSREHGLQVIPASMLREEAIDSLEKASVLGITLAISFATRQVGESFRVNVDLIDVRNRRQIDADTIDAAATDVIDLEERVSIAVLRMLQIELLPTESQSFGTGTRNARAYDLFLRGQGFLADFNEPAKVDAAIELFERAVAADPAYARARAGLGEALFRHYRRTNERRWIDRAMEECRRAIELDDREAMGYVCLGTLHAGMGRPELAVEEFAKAAALAPTLDAAYRGLAAAYEAQGKLELAEATYREAIRARPHYWGGHHGLAEFYLRLGRIDESIAGFVEVIKLAPDGYSGYSNLGVAYYYAERWDDAENAFNRALEIHPEDQAALSNLGTLQFFLGRYGDAARTFERARTLNDTDYRIWGNLADSYYWSAGEREQAAPAYRRAIALAAEQLKVNPRDAKVLMGAAFYHAMIGEAGAARDQIARALELAPTDVDVRLVAAQVEQRLGDSNAALDSLEAAIAAGYPRAEIRVDPVFAELAGNARFEALTAPRP